MDIIFLLGAVAMVAAMLGMVIGCERLGAHQ